MKNRIPKKEVLDLYYKLWSEGATYKKICSELRRANPEIESCPYRNRTVTSFKKKMDDLAPYFLMYCRDRMAKETRKNLSNKTSGNHMPLTDEIAAEFVSHIEGGLDYNVICSLMGIPLPTLLDIWFKEYPIFHAKVKYAVLLQTAGANKALYKSAVGSRYVELSETETSGDSIGRDGWGGCSTSKTKSVRQAQPNVTALKFWLINREPDRWTIDGNNPKKNNRGRILEALDNMASITEEELKEMDNE